MWKQDPVEALEDLLETDETALVTNRAPVLSRPTLQVHVSLVPEDAIGPYGSHQRRQTEKDLLRAFTQQQDGCIAAGYGTPVTATGEVTRSYQVDYAFFPTAEGTEARQQLRDLGGATLTVPISQQLVFLPCLDGPGRLPSSLVRIVVSGLPFDFMIPGAIRVLLESAGYTTGGSEGVIIRAEHGGEQKAEIAAFAPNLMKLGIVVGIVRPPTSDPTLSQLPRHFMDGSSTITIRVTGSKLQQPPEQPTANVARRVFVPADIAAQPPPATTRQPLLRPLDAVMDLHGRSHGDRRGLGMSQIITPPPRPPPYPPGFGPAFTTWRGLPMLPLYFWNSPLPPPPRGTPPAHAFGPVPMEVERTDMPPAAYATEGPGEQTPLLAQHGPAEAVPMEMEPVRVALPDVQLVDSTMRWLEDEEDPARTLEARREHLCKLHSQYPAVWQNYAGDCFFPPAPEVRSSLRELGGLPTDQASKERPCSSPLLAATSTSLDPTRSSRRAPDSD